MLATKANVSFEGPSGELKNRYCGTFLYKKSGEQMKCQVEFMMMADIPMEVMHEDIVSQINDKMCREYPYDELVEIEALEPRAAQVQSADALAAAIVEEVKKIQTNDTGETWPQVVQRCIAQFKDKVTTLDVLFEFFEPVTRMFLERGYREGYKDAMGGARQAFMQRVEQRLKEMEGGSFEEARSVELRHLLEWLKR